VVAIHGWAAAGCQQHGLGGHIAKAARTHIDQQNAGQRLPVRGWNERYRAMLFEALDRPRPNLLHQPVDDLDPGKIALVHGAIEGLAGKCLAMQRPVGVAIEETADLVFQLLHALDGLAHERPGHVLVGQPLAALDGIHEVTRDGVTRVERDVVAALNHARAAALADQALAGDGNAEVRVGLIGVQSRKQTGTAGTQD
jgi:hypothetical protein